MAQGVQAARRRAFRATTFDEEKAAILGRAKQINALLNSSGQDSSDNGPNSNDSNSSSSSNNRDINKDSNNDNTNANSNKSDGGDPTIETHRYKVEALTLGKELQREVCQEASAEVRDDQEAMLAVLELAPLLFEHCSEATRANVEAAVLSVGRFPHLIRFASEELRGDKQAMLRVVEANGLTVEFASPELQGDKELMLKALASDARAIQYADEVLTNDEDIVIASIVGPIRVPEHFDCMDAELELDRADRLGDGRDSDETGLACASLELRRDKDFLLKAERLRRKSDREEEEEEEEDGESCYLQADASVWREVPAVAFEAAVNSVLAHRGETAPILTISLLDRVGASSINNSNNNNNNGNSNTTDNNNNNNGNTTDNNNSSNSNCLVTLVSGQVLSHRLARPEDLVNNFAKSLLQELAATTSEAEFKPERVFLVVNSRSDDPTESRMLTPWDWNRPLADFLPSLC